jgi:prevent-host-death family protein
MSKVPATEFKARCLELMDRVAERRETYVITKHGRPVAKLAPVDAPKEHHVFGCMADQTEFVGDLEEPPRTEKEWQQFERQRVKQMTAWEREWRRHGTISGSRTVGLPPGFARPGSRARRVSRRKPG